MFLHNWIYFVLILYFGYIVEGKETSHAESIFSGRPLFEIHLVQKVIQQSICGQNVQVLS